MVVRGKVEVEARAGDTRSLRDPRDARAVESLTSEFLDRGAEEAPARQVSLALARRLLAKRGLHGGIISPDLTGVNQY